jgi:hypothetical protein
MYNFMSLNASDPSSAYQSLTTTTRVLQAVVEAIGSFPLAAKVKPAARHLLDGGSHGAGAHTGSMRLRLIDGSGAEVHIWLLSLQLQISSDSRCQELFQAWRAVLTTMLKIHNRLEGWPLQRVSSQKNVTPSIKFLSLTLHQRVKAALLRLSSAISGLVSLNTVTQPHGYQYAPCSPSTLALFGSIRVLPDAPSGTSPLSPSPWPSSSGTSPPSPS